MNLPININILVVTLDSCRWDSYYHANTPNLNSFCDMREAFSQGTFTYSSHMAMYKGLFPAVKQDIKYYNRFSKPLFRINNRDITVDSFINFPKGTKTIIDGFNNINYYTIGLAAMQWFKDDDLFKPFSEFYFTGINAQKQIDIFLKKIRDHKKSV